MFGYVTQQQLAQYAAAARKKCGEPVTSDKLIKMLKNNSGDLARCPADVVFDDSEIHERELARAVPDAEREWTKYTIYVRPFFQDHLDDLAPLLAHEMAHVIFGQALGADRVQEEENAHRFAIWVTGWDREKYDAMRKSYEALLTDGG